MKIQKTSKSLQLLRLACLMIASIASCHCFTMDVLPLQCEGLGDIPGTITFGPATSRDLAKRFDNLVTEPLEPSSVQYLGGTCQSTQTVLGTVAGLAKKSLAVAAAGAVVYGLCTHPFATSLITAYILMNAPQFKDSWWQRSALTISIRSGIAKLARASGPALWAAATALGTYGYFCHPIIAGGSIGYTASCVPAKDIACGALQRCISPIKKLFTSSKEQPQPTDSSTSVALCDKPDEHMHCTEALRSMHMAWPLDENAPSAPPAPAGYLL